MTIRILLMLLVIYALGMVVYELRYDRWYKAHCRYGDEIRTNGDCHNPTPAWAWPLAW